MKRFRIVDFRLSLPTSWAEVTLEQFLTLNDNENREPSYILSVLSNTSQEELRNLKAYDLDLLVFEHLQFLETLPNIPTDPPSHLIIDGKSIEMIKDLGPEVSYGQMCDVRFIIKSKQQDEEPVTPLTMASTILPIFLWNRLRTNGYTNWHDAAELWKSIKTISCIDGLSASGFFLLNSLKLPSSGRIQEEETSRTTLSGWLRTLRPAFLRSIRTSKRKA